MNPLTSLTRKLKQLCPWFREDDDYLDLYHAEEAFAEWMSDIDYYMAFALSGGVVSTAIKSIELRLAQRTKEQIEEAIAFIDEKMLDKPPCAAITKLRNLLVLQITPWATLDEVVGKHRITGCYRSSDPSWKPTISSNAIGMLKLAPTTGFEGEISDIAIREVNPKTIPVIKRVYYRILSWFGR